MTTETNRSVLNTIAVGNATLLAGLFATLVVAAGLVMPLSASADAPHGTAPDMYDWYTSYPDYEEEYDWYTSYPSDEYYTYEEWYEYEDYSWYDYEYYDDYYYEDYYSYYDDYSYYYDDYYYEDYYYDDYDDCYSCGCSGGCYEPEPVCALSASDTTIEEGDDVTLHWTSENAFSAILSGFGNVSTGGSRTVSPNHDTTYTLTVFGHGGEKDVCTVHINVEEEEDDDDLWCELDISDSRVEEGDEVTLEWDTRGAEYASINHGIGRVDEDGGEEEVEVDEDTTFRLTVRDDDGDEETCSATVRVDDENDFSSIRFDGDPVNNPPTVYLSQLPYTGLEDLSPSLIAAIAMLAALLGIGGYFFFLKRKTA
ncbi:MAG TPA: LPXTG cell wall anchor domain-containing protein [Candidatus Paceibacterota bacterium]|nr:LPXTG cell wall anchor domain-containing protein [Candidatus Paceibacterota bacterium]